MHHSADRIVFVKLNQWTVDYCLDENNVTIKWSAYIILAIGPHKYSCATLSSYYLSHFIKYMFGTVNCQIP